MRKTPKGLRLHIAIFGRRNAGKSSLLNILTQQNVSIVSDTPGTTTDPVEKPMELLPIGPVLFIDTAGLDDIGALGKLRVRKSYKAFERADIILLVTEANKWGKYEEKVLEEAKKRDTPVLVVLNKVDIFKPDVKVKERLEKRKIPYVKTCCSLSCSWDTTAEVKREIIKLLPPDWIAQKSILGDIIGPGDLVILVIPIDKEAPKGRLILPQQQSIRDILDKKALCLITNEKNLREALINLNIKPKLVITDSQAFKEVFATVPSDIPLTSFSILFARFKGDLDELVRGAKKIDELRQGDKILICEACTHHPIGDDIGRVKIPRWIKERIGGKIDFDVYTGHDFPEDVKQYKLIIHCGACTLNRKEMLSRIYEAKKQDIPITNYGVAIAYLHGELERAIDPFKRHKYISQIVFDSETSVL
ncbi:[FeFe] hydrogenase H-cluster maturation GTPase HydF [Candidatus Aerophobetes bacterium]|uniref:[FeFe] hydrogenase H-cluster maturation GTPase HydF n=1 Tax=Aerophobetes bacterium TaxID=2030807 RepID=A0A662DHM9_UNCAE|nr:MAG: [FeFe] hydrogenase H-cluster maturation GTPase HydF [Candidatus Aerophobetes bacterium]